MKRIAVDFDGTLFTDEYPKIGKPKWRVINWCKERKEKGDILVLWTCREGESLREAIGMCREVGLIFDYVNQNDASLKKQFGNDCRKVGADIYLDDKAMRIEDIGESGMTEYDLKAKICDILYGVDFACGRENCTACGFSAMGYEECKNARKASVLIKSGLKFDTVVSHTATFDMLQKNRINELEKRIAEAEHRAARAERALDKAVELAYEFRTEADTLSCSSCPMFHIFDSCKDRGLYQDCSKQWKEELIKQAEKELAEENDGKKEV